MVNADTPYPQNAFMRLPNEVLENILNYASTDFESWGPRDTARYDLDTVRSLVTVCSRFSRIALPLLYQRITIDLPRDQSFEKLHAAIQTNAIFRDHCQTLEIGIRDIFPLSSHYFPLLHDVICGLPKVHDLKVSGGYGNNVQETWAIICLASQKMPGVRSLRLSPVGNGPSVGNVLEHVGFPSLQSLDIHGMYRPHDGSKGDDVVDPTKHRTASFTSLTLSDYEEDPAATALLLQWPKSLVHFKLHNLSNPEFYFGLPMFTKWLSIHSDTLQSVHIGFLSVFGQGRLFDATAFPRLEVLTLSRWELAPRGGAKGLTFSDADADLLLGPSLHTFGLDFSSPDQRREDWTDFGDAEEDWVRGLANAAISRKAKLRKIRITFTPADWSEGKEDGYPWDRMDRIHDDIEPQGVVLEYNEPGMTKEEWLEEGYGKDESL